MAAFENWSRSCSFTTAVTPACDSLRPLPLATVITSTGRSAMKRIGKGEPITASPSMATCARKTPLTLERHDSVYLPSLWSVTLASTGASTSTSFFLAGSLLASGVTPSQGLSVCRRTISASHSTSASPPEHAFPILSRDWSSRVQPHRSSWPTVPASGPRHRVASVPCALAGPGTTSSLNGLPGRGIDCSRRATCSSYVPTWPTE